MTWNRSLTVHQHHAAKERPTTLSLRLPQLLELATEPTIMIQPQWALDLHPRVAVVKRGIFRVQVKRITRHYLPATLRLLLKCSTMRYGMHQISRTISLLLLLIQRLNQSRFHNERAAAWRWWITRCTNRQGPGRTTMWCMRMLRFTRQTTHFQPISDVSDDLFASNKQNSLRSGLLVIAHLFRHLQIPLS